MGKLSIEAKQDIINKYHTHTSTELAQMYGVSRGMITKLWKDNGLSGKKRTLTKENFVGKKINMLTVIGKTDKRDAAGNIKWECLCDCGNTAYVSSTRLKSGAAKSCGCLSVAALDKGRIDKSIDRVGTKFGLLTVIKEEKTELGKPKKWICKCECGRTKAVLATNLLTGNTKSCGMCGFTSAGNSLIDEILSKNNIPFEREKKFDTCKDKRHLPFDFFVNNRYLIEFDGIQHFDKNNRFYSETGVLHDKIKNDWAKANNIPLIRIPYTYIDKITLKDLIPETSSFLI